MSEQPVIKAKIWGAYRPCYLIGSTETHVTVRVLGGYGRQGMPDTHRLPLANVRKADRPLCQPK